MKYPSNLSLLLLIASIMAFTSTTTNIAVNWKKNIIQHMYEGVYAEMVYANKFNENSDLSTTYLGQTKMTRDTKIRAEE